jgi:2-polyprenyl-6-methoxyphenol hydroxylase-like FAD-dependent oxidoreductase
MAIPEHRPGLLVAGGGIGGLTAALSLHAAGIDVVVVESARRLQPLGVGINLLPHAMRELSELGLGEAVEAAGVATQELAYFDRFGSRISSEPRGRAAGYRWPQVSIHRGELQMLLLDAVHERLGAECMRTGLAVDAFEHAHGAVRVHLRDRSTGAAHVVVADGLVGADGIHSTVRAALHPGEGPPIWNGIQMWRGVSTGSPFGSGRTMIMAGSNRRAKFVAYPIARYGRSAQINWVAEVRIAAPGAPFARPDWRRRGRAADLLAHFADWRFDWLDVPALIAAAATIFEYPMVDRDPLRRWGSGRVTLLGDAAHPMYPIGSNGASQAIIDARVLAFELARSSGAVRRGMAAYEATRHPATSALVLANRRHGPEQILSIVDERAPNGFAHIDDVLSREELTTITDVYRRTAGFDVETLNARPSWSVEPARAGR